MTAKAKGNISETVRVALWEEALRFAEELASEGVWSDWLLCGNFPTAKFRDGGWTEQEKCTFFQKVGLSRSVWISEVDRRINVDSFSVE